MRETYAPFNFIPFERVDVPKPYQKKEDLPSLNQEKEGHYSGRITYELTNHTDLSIGGNQDGSFCKDGRGRYIVPGNTMRGLIHNHVELLSFSYPKAVDDERYMFRKLDDKCTKIRKEYTRKLMHTVETAEGEISELGVRAGIIYAKRGEGGDTFYIQPLADYADIGCSYVRVFEGELRRANVLEERCYMYQEPIEAFDISGVEKEKIGDFRAAYHRQLREIRNRNYDAYRGATISFQYQNHNVMVGDGPYEGTVLNSAWVNGKTHHYIVSTKEVGEPLKIDIEDVLTYRNDYARNCILNHRLERNRQFYDLPDKLGKENGKIFFYHEEKGHLMGFGATPYFRVFYDQSVADGIPLAKDEEGYDYAEALFGYMNKNDSYKSRVSFQNAVITDSKVQSYREELCLQSPHGTAFHIYLDQAGREFYNLNTYNSRQFRLRGYKFYWKRSKAFPEQKSRVSSLVGVLPAGNTFCGSIYYKNLSKEELGLLLCAIQYKNATDTSKTESYMIGSGKPYGYGKVELHDIKLYRTDYKASFTSLQLMEEDITGEIEHLKQSYRDNLKEQFGIQLEDEPAVQTYLAYAYLENADDYLNRFESVYMKPSGKGDYSYSNRIPLPPAMQVMHEMDTYGIEEEIEREDRWLWVAKYRLTDEQYDAVKEMSGNKKHRSIIDWLNTDNIEHYAKQYTEIALPSKTNRNIQRRALQLFEHVYIAKKGIRWNEKKQINEEYDLGWEQLK